MEGEIWAFLGGIVLTGISMIVRDAVMKNTFKHKIDLLQLAMKAQEKVDEKQDAEIRTVRENQITFRENMVQLQTRFNDLYLLQKEEVKSLQVTMNETNQRFASLDATLKGISQWLQRVEQRIKN